MPSAPKQIGAVWCCKRATINSSSSRSSGSHDVAQFGARKTVDVSAEVAARFGFIVLHDHRFKRGTTEPEHRLDDARAIARAVECDLMRPRGTRRERAGIRVDQSFGRC